MLCFLGWCRWQWPNLSTTETAASAPAQLFVKTRLIMLPFLAPICTTYWNRDFPEAEEELFGQQIMPAADTYRSRGAPWLLSLWVVTGDHIATACLRNPELLDSPDVGSHCEQSAPIAYGSVCRKRYPNQARHRTSMPKLTFFKKQELWQMSVSERGRCLVWHQWGLAVPKHEEAVHRVSTRRHSHHSPGSMRSQVQNGFTGLKSQLLLFPYAPNNSSL